MCPIGCCEVSMLLLNFCFACLLIARFLGCFQSSMWRKIVIIGLGMTYDDKLDLSSNLQNDGAQVVLPVPPQKDDCKSYNTTLVLCRLFYLAYNSSRYSVMS